jgi:hypothetical protein
MLFCNPKLRPSVGAKVSGLVALFPCLLSEDFGSGVSLCRRDFVDEISGFVLLFCPREEQVYCLGVFRVRREAGGEGVASYAGGISSC